MSDPATLKFRPLRNGVMAAERDVLGLSTKKGTCLVPMGCHALPQAR
jgi:hypothetical protein